MQKLSCILLFLMLCGITFVFRKSDDGDTVVDIYTYTKIASFGILGLFALLNVPTIKQSPMSNSATALLLLGLVLLGTAPIGAIPLYSLVCSILFLCCVCSSIAFASIETDWPKVLHLFLMVDVVASVLLYLAGVPFATTIDTAGGQMIPRMCGLNGYATIAADYCSLLAIVATLRWQRGVISGRYALFSVMVAFAALIVSHSRTSTVVTAFTIICMLAGSYRQFLALTAVILAPVLSIFVIMVLQFNQKLATTLARSGNIDELFTGNGRTVIWESAFHLIMRSPLQGYGYSGSKELLKEMYLFSETYIVLHSHNIFLQAWLNGGVLSLLLVVALLLLLIREYLYSSDTMFGIPLYVFASGLMSTGFFRITPDGVTLIFCLATVALGMRPYATEDDDDQEEDEEEFEGDSEINPRLTAVV